MYRSTVLALGVTLSSLFADVRAQVYGHCRLCDSYGQWAGYFDDGIISDNNKTPLFEVQKVTGGILRGRTSGRDPIFVAGNSLSPDTYEVFNANEEKVGTASLKFGNWTFFDLQNNLVYQTCNP